MDLATQPLTTKPQIPNKTTRKEVRASTTAGSGGGKGVETVVNDTRRVGRIKGLLEQLEVRVRVWGLGYGV